MPSIRLLGKVFLRQDSDKLRLTARGASAPRLTDLPGDFLERLPLNAKPVYGELLFTLQSATHKVHDSIAAIGNVSMK